MPTLKVRAANPFKKPLNWPFFGCQWVPEIPAFSIIFRIRHLDTKKPVARVFKQVCGRKDGLKNWCAIQGSNTLSLPRKTPDFSHCVTKA
jgi:hypothetical protein